MNILCLFIYPFPYSNSSTRYIIDFEKEEKEMEIK